MALAPLTIFPQSITSGDTTRLLLGFALCPATTFTAVLVLNRAGVAVSPGTIFGEHGEGYVRLCYSNSAENIEKAIERMRTTLATASGASAR